MCIDCPNSVSVTPPLTESVSAPDIGNAPVRAPLVPNDTSGAGVSCIECQAARVQNAQEEQHQEEKPQEQQPRVILDSGDFGKFCCQNLVFAFRYVIGFSKE